MMNFLKFLLEWEETKKFSNLKSVIKAQPEDIASFLDEVATKKGKKSWIIVPPNEHHICLVAHIDRIFNPKGKMKIEYKGHGEKKVWSSKQGIGGDDRCGVYALLHIYRTLPVKDRPIILFTDEEETGLHGAKEAAKIFKEELKDVKFFIELDRRGKNDMVYYNDEPQEFQQHIQKHGFEKAWGSTSDIKVLGRKFKKVSVNLSVGYFDQHTKNEYIIVKHLLDTINKVKGICITREPLSPEASKLPKEKKYEYGGGGYQGGYGTYYSPTRGSYEYNVGGNLDNWDEWERDYWEGYKNKQEENRKRLADLYNKSYEKAKPKSKDYKSLSKFLDGELEFYQKYNYKRDYNETLDELIDSAYIQHKLSDENLKILNKMKLSTKVTLPITTTIINLKKRLEKMKDEPEEKIEKSAP